MSNKGLFKRMAERHPIGKSLLYMGHKMRVIQHYNDGAGVAVAAEHFDNRGVRRVFTFGISDLNKIATEAGLQPMGSNHV